MYPSVFIYFLVLCQYEKKTLKSSKYEKNVKLFICKYNTIITNKISFLDGCNLTITIYVNLRKTIQFICSTTFKILQVLYYFFKTSNL